MVDSLCLQCRGTGSTSGWGTKIPYAIWYGQKKRAHTHTPPPLSMYEGEKKGGLDEKIITLLNNTAFSFECFTYINPHPYSYNRE